MESVTGTEWKKIHVDEILAIRITHRGGASVREAHLRGVFGKGNTILVKHHALGEDVLVCFGGGQAGKEYVIPINRCHLHGGTFIS